MNLLPRNRHAFPPRQRGAASVAIAFLILLIIGAALATALSMSGSAARDAAMSEEQVEALFLAESGIERALRRLANGTACASLVPDSPASQSLGAGTLSLLTASGSSTNCQIRIRGTVRGTTRTVDAQITNAGATIVSDVPSEQASTTATSSLSWSHTVGTGSNRILIVGVSIQDRDERVDDITRDGQTLTRAGQRERNNARVEIWYLIAPNPGTATITISLSNDTEVVAGAVSLAGVNQSQDLTTQFSSATGNDSAPTVSITPATVNAWVVDTLAFRQRGGTPPGVTATVGAGQAQRWNTQSGFGNNEIGGAGSTEGPVNPAASVTMSWRLTRNDRSPPGNSVSRDWALGAVYVRSSPQAVSWSEVIN